MQLYKEILGVAYEHGNKESIKAITKKDAPEQGPPGNGQSHHKFLVDQMGKIYDDLEQMDWDCGLLVVVKEDTSKLKKRLQHDINFMDDSVDDADENGILEEGTHGDKYADPVTDDEDA